MIDLVVALPFGQNQEPIFRTSCKHLASRPVFQCWQLIFNLAFGDRSHCGVHNLWHARGGCCAVLFPSLGLEISSNHPLPCRIICVHGESLLQSDSYLAHADADRRPRGPPCIGRQYIRRVVCHSHTRPQILSRVYRRR
jgi:hypothetical protein